MLECPNHSESAPDPRQRMPQRPLLSCLCLSIVAAFGTSQAWALGFARAQPSVTMGAPLDFVVGVRVDAGEVLLHECVAAEVWIGDNAVPRAAVGASLESAGGTPTIRVRTLGRIDEPIVTVNVTAGCESKVSRRYTLFADPPGVTAGVPAVVSPEPLPVPALAPAQVAAPTDRGPPKTASPSSAAPQGVVAAAPGTRPAAPPRREARSEKAVAAGDSLSPAKARKTSVADGAGARLRLDAPSVTFASDQAAIEAAERREEALAAVRAAINVAQAATNAASARVGSMEASIEALKKESKSNREAMARLQQSLSDADERGRWTPGLIGAVVALLGVAGWLYARLRRTEQERQQAWWNSSNAVGASAAPLPGAPMESAAPAVEAPAATAAAVATPAPQPPTQRVAPTTFFDAPPPPTQATQPIPAGVVVPDSPLRDVSIEELLDVEQQAEFFVVLGQDEAAIDLLMGHLRSTGGASPLPYLKLLEIYHRRGDQASYDRMRRRFNERFNAVAPEWSTGLQAGRCLEDYPDVMAQVQRSWPRPVDAMADLETLLFRTHGGDLFDLPAYRDVLFLFTLARDLQEMAQHDAPRVDVLLPLDQSGATASAAADSGALTQPESLSMDLLDPPTLVPPDATRPAALTAATSEFGALTLAPRKIS